MTRSILKKSYPLDMNDVWASALHVNTMQWAALWMGRSLQRIGITERLRKQRQRG